MPDSTLALQAAIIAAVKADATLIGLIGGRIYDQKTPAEVVFPYVKFAGWDGEPWDTDTSRGWETFVELGVFSRSGDGTVELHQIFAALSALLHRAALAPEGHALVMCLLDGQRLGPLTDGETPRGVQTYRIKTGQ